MEGCMVCDGTGLLLEDTCPLCEKDDQKWAASLQHTNQEALPRMASSINPPGATKHASSHALCLVLDIDGTLLSELAPDDYNFESHRYLRPHLRNFLDYAFGTFGAVGIWTAASETWLRLFLDVVDPKCQRSWAFTWSGKLNWGHPDFTSDCFYPSRRPVKSLHKIWRNKSLRAMGYCRRSTLIIENTPSLCTRNYGNAIYVKTFGENSTINEDDNDDHLLVLMRYLGHLAKLHTSGISMRCIEKRGWYVQAKHEHSS